MSGIKDTATVTLNVNGAQAKQMMSDLEDKIKQTKATIDSMKAAMANPKDIEKAKKQLTTYQKQLDEMKSATEGVNKALGNLDTATPRQLEKALRTLNKQMKDMTPGDEVWESHVEKIKEIKERLAELREEMAVQQTWWQRAVGWVNKWQTAILGVVAGSGTVIDIFRQSVDAYADMDQEMANVRKFTGMTEKQVADLNEEFKKMDTRSSREQLNKLAQEAGRLGKTSKEDVLGFVRAADQINVALDDLGEGATLTLSKLTGIFGDEERYGTEQALLKVGSVINELSQNCSASAPYLAEFSSRLGGVGAQAGMTIQQIMGYGAVLDANAQKVEASATALSQIIVRLYQDPAKYAKVAGIEVESFANLMREDANAALILFLETLQKAGGMDVLSPMFKDMGENGSRAIAALSTLATHIDMVKAQQQAANVAFEEGTSVTNEFLVQNTTVEASLEKAKKAVNELRVELGERLYPLMGHIYSSTSALVRAFLSMINFVRDHKESIIILSSAIVAHVVILKLHALWLNRTAVATVLLDNSSKALAVTQKLFGPIWATLRLGAAALTNSFMYLKNGLQVTYSMQERWRKSMQAMSFGSWTGLILVLASAIYLLYRHIRSVQEAQRVVGKIRSEAIAKMGEEKAQIDLLVAAAENEALSLEERRRAIDKLNDIIPGYNGLLDETTGKYEANKAALDEYLKSLTRKYELEGAKEKLAELGREKATATVALNEAQTYYDRASKSGSGVVYTTSWGSVGNTSDDLLSHAESKLAKKQAELDAIVRKEQKILDAYGVDLLKEVATSSSDDNDPNPENVEPPAPVPDLDDGKKPSRFAEEDSWRRQNEAKARISYTRGIADYQEYTDRMDAIAVEYYSRLLERTDLSADERLDTQAKYWESVNKYTVHGTEELIAEENEAYRSLLEREKQAYAERISQVGISAVERENSQRLYDEAVELATLEHLRTLASYYEEGSAERLKIEEQYLDARIKAAKRHQDESERQEAMFAEMKKDYFGNNQSEDDAEFNKQMSYLNEVYNRELAAVGNNEAEKLRIKEAYMAAELLLRKKYNQKGSEDASMSYRDAIQKSIEWLNSDGGKALTGTVSTLISGMSSIFSGLSTMIQAELDIQSSKIERRYDREVQLAQGNSYRVAKAEKQKEAEIAKAKNEANKKMFAMQVVQAVAQTATNALNAYGSAAAIPVVGHVLAPIAAAMAVAAGMIQVQAIKKQQQAAEAQGYSKGGFTKPGAVDEPAGIVHAGEWVASQKLLANPVARPMIDALDYAQRTNTIGSLRAGDVSRSITAPVELARITETDSSSAAMVAVMARSSQVINRLEQRLDEPFVTINTVTGDHGINAAKSEYNRLINNKSPKSRKNAIDY